MAASGDFHVGFLKRSVAAGAPRAAAWARVRRIADLRWAAGVTGARLLRGPRSGPGAVREIEFGDGSVVREIITGWEEGRAVSYVASDGLPLRAYHATVSLGPAGRGRTRITWRSRFESERMTGAEFAAFRARLGSFYSASLAALRSELEAGGRRGRAPTP